MLMMLQAETEQKENFAAALTASRKALDESRQERGSLRYEVDAKNRKAEALATELHLTETSLSERQAEVALLKGHERDYLLKIATLEVIPCYHLIQQIWHYIWKELYAPSNFPGMI